MLSKPNTPNEISLLLVSMLLFPLATLGQQLSLSGKVLDAETKASVSYSTILLTGTSIATISNADGEFSLTVPEPHTTDTLTISMMGYAPFNISVLDIRNPQNITVKLKPRPIPLAEIIIIAKRTTAKELVQKAFETIETNFPTDPYKLNAFYREMHSENNRSVKLIEAAIDVYDIGYKPITDHRYKLQEKVNLKNVRASKNYRNDCFKQTVVERYNRVVSALRNNPIRYRNPNTHQWMRNKNFTIDSVLYLNDKLVYVVSFLSYIPKFPNFERKNTIYIDAGNYAIYKYLWEEYAQHGKYSEKPWHLSKESIYLTNRKRISTIYEYGSYRGKMYLKYFDEKCYDDIMNSKTDSVEFEALGHVTLIVGQVETDHIEMPREETLRRDQSLATQIKEYQPRFWTNYEQVKLVPLTRKNVKDLEREMPLEQQFKNEGAANEIR